MSMPNQGDIISFKPELATEGREQQGARPWLVVSVKPYNDASKFAMVCPITSHQGTATSGNAAEVLLPANCGAHRLVLTFQLQTIVWQARRARVLGTVPVATMRAVQRNLRMCLGF